MVTTPTKKPLTVYGPVQLRNHLDLSAGQFACARDEGHIPAPDRSGKWSPALVEQIRSSLADILAAVGPNPYVGATTGAALLSARLNLDVNRSAIPELHRMDLLPTVPDYDGYTMYDGRVLDRLDDVAAVQTAMTNGRLLMTDAAAKHLGVRGSDVRALLKQGWLKAADWGHSSWEPKRAGDNVALYRVGRLNELLADERIDWEAVRATAPGKRSPFLKLPQLD
jgi:hypothetical protein